MYIGAVPAIRVHIHTVKCIFTRNQRFGMPDYHKPVSWAHGSFVAYCNGFTVLLRRARVSSFYSSH